MATDDVAFYGKGKWVRVTVPDPQFKKYSLRLYPTPESLEKFKALKKEGVKNFLKRDEDGDYFNISRPSEKIIKGVLRAFEPPLVLMADGQTPMRNVNIGNGSDLTVTCKVYSHRTPTGGTAKAMRLESIRVDNLVPFEARKDFKPGSEQEEQAKSIINQPTPVWE
jgi:hypothetical protein